MKIERVKSGDGTAITFESVGEGAPLILVGGAFCDRSARAAGTPLAALLAERFTVFSYDRRGRGDSQDTPPYAVEREIEDLAALIDVAGGSASVYGISSGALLAFDSAARGLSIPKLALYEPPLVVDAERAKSFAGMPKELAALIAAGRRADAVQLFLTRVMQMPSSVVLQMRKAPIWAGLEKLAHTLSYDLTITVRGRARLEQAAQVRASALVLDGGASPAWMREGSRTLGGAIPGAEQRTLEGQTHDVDVQVLARALTAFFEA